MTGRVTATLGPTTTVAIA